MIAQLRIDERMIHGQITTAWSKALDVSGIVVADDEVAADELTKNALLMTAPAGRKVAVRSVEETIKLLTDPRADKMKILLIVRNPQNALLLEKALSIKEVNVANFMKKKSPNKVQLTDHCRADEEDLEFFRQLVEATRACGGEIFAQIIPSMPREDFISAVKKAKFEGNV